MIGDKRRQLTASDFKTIVMLNCKGSEGDREMLLNLADNCVEVFNSCVAGIENLNNFLADHGVSDGLVIHCECEHNRKVEEVGGR